MVGTIGPLVQGVLPRWRWRLQITALFVTGFLVGAAAIFFLSFLLGQAVLIRELPVTLRRAIAASGLVTLAMMDMWARNAGTYCPVGLRRQTPRALSRRHSMLVVASIWGFDTGLAVTTFRVTAATWGALLLTVLGLSGWATGVAYGIAFAAPISVLMWTHRAGRIAEAVGPCDTGLAELLGMRQTWQIGSMIALIATSMILTGELLYGCAM